MLDGREFMFTPNYASADEVHKIAVDNSSVLAWTEHVGMKAEDLHMQRSQLTYDRYAAWCKRGFLKPVSLTRFYDEMLGLYPTLDRRKVRAAKVKLLYGCSPQGLGRVQYSAFVIGELYERELGEGKAYAEVVTERHSLTSYSKGGMDTRENIRVEEANLGVWPLADLDLDDPAASRWDAIDRYAEVLDRLSANLARYEE